MALFQLAIAVFVAFLAAPPVGADENPRPGWNEVSAVFEKRCVNCHSRLGAAKALRLDSYDGVIAGSENGAVVLPRNAAGSEMIRRLRGQSKPRMPFLSTPLPPDEIEVITRWIDIGLPVESGAN